VTLKTLSRQNILTWLPHINQNHMLLSTHVDNNLQQV